jgi:hypothetical protein
VQENAIKVLQREFLNIPKLKPNGEAELEKSVGKDGHPLGWLERAKIEMKKINAEKERQIAMNKAGVPVYAEERFTDMPGFRA